MKKSISLVLLLALLLSLCGCGADEPEQTDVPAEPAVSASPESLTAGEPDFEPVPMKLTAHEKFEPNLYCTFNGISMSLDSGLAYYDILVVNMTEEDLVLRLDGCVINGQTIDLIEENNSMTVKAGGVSSSSADSCFAFDLSNVFPEGLPVIDDALFTLSKVTEDGKQVLESRNHSKYEDVTLEFRGIRQNMGLWELVLYARNDSDSEICLSLSELEIDGVPVPLIAEDVILAPGEELYSDRDYLFDTANLVFKGSDRIEKVSFLIQNFGDVANRQRFEVDLALPEDAVQAQEESAGSAVTLWEEENLRIDYLGIKESSFGEKLLDLSIDNRISNSEEQLEIIVHDVMIDGNVSELFMGNTFFSVPYGSVYSTAGNNNLMLILDNVGEMDIDSIGNISFTMMIIGYQGTLGNGHCELPVSLCLNEDVPDHHVQTDVADAPVLESLIQEEGLTVDYLGMMTDRHSAAPELRIVNGRDSQIALKMESIQVNSRSLDYYLMPCNVPAGGTRNEYSGFSFAWSTLSDYGIESIESLDFRLVVQDEESGEEISSKDVSLVFEQALTAYEERPGSEIMSGVIEEMLSGEIVESEYAVRFVDVVTEPGFYIDLYVVNKTNSDLYLRLDNLLGDGSEIETHESYVKVDPNNEYHTGFNMIGFQSGDGNKEKPDTLSFDVLVVKTPTGAVIDSANVSHKLKD